MSYHTLRAAIFLTAFLLPVGLMAHEEGEHHETQFHAKVRLTPTADAPAEASGKAKLEAETEDGESSAELEIETSGLPDGEYTVLAIRKSDASSSTIGTVLVPAANSEDDDDEGDVDDDGEEHEKDHGDKGGDDEGDDEGEHHDGGHHDGEAEQEFNLPLDLDPTDIAQIQIVDANSVVMLVGDFSELTGGCSMKFRGKASLEPGVAGPEANGLATMRLEVKKKKQKSRFTLVGKNVPPNSALSVQVNGTEVASVTSNKKGRVMVKKLPFTDLTIVQQVTLVDADGNVVASADFAP